MECLYKKSISIDDKEVYLVPKDIQTSDKLNLKIEHEILKNLEEQDNFEYLKSTLEENLANSHLQMKENNEKLKFPINDESHFSPTPTDMVQIDPSFAGYLNLHGFPLYLIPKNHLYLKASSLFNDTILFENELWLNQKDCSSP